MSVVLLCVGIKCSNMVMTKQVTDFLFVIFCSALQKWGHQTAWRSITIRREGGGVH